MKTELLLSGIYTCISIYLYIFFIDFLIFLHNQQLLHHLISPMLYKDFQESAASFLILFYLKSEQIVLETSKSPATPTVQIPAHTHTYTDTHVCTEPVFVMQMQLCFGSGSLGFLFALLQLADEPHHNEQQLPRPSRQFKQHTHTHSHSLMTATGNCQQKQTALSAGNFAICAGRCCLCCCTNELLPLRNQHATYTSLTSVCIYVCVWLFANLPRRL